MTRKHRRTFAPLFAIAVACMAAVAAPAPVLAMQILEAADHAELTAEISATGVQPHRAQPRPDREGGARARRLRGRARRRLGRPLPAADWDGPRGRGPVRGRKPLHRHGEGLHLPADANPGGAGFGADPDPQCCRTSGGGRRCRACRPGGRDRRPCRGAGAPGARGGGPGSAARPRNRRRGRGGGLRTDAHRDLAGVRGWRRSSSRPPVRHRSVRTRPRTSPGPSRTCRASGASPPSGWRRPAPARRAAGSRWR